MNLIDFILNLALLFLWVDWRSGALARHPHSVLSLANAVRPAERRMGSGKGSLIVLIGILLVRPCFYYSIGSKLNWTPDLDLLAFSVPWRSDLLDRMYIYSTITFLVTLGIFYTVLSLLSSVNRKLSDADVMQQFVRLQMGWLERLPWFFKLLLPPVVAALAWIGLLPLMAALDLLPAQPAGRQLLGQALAFALASILVWKWLLIALFLLHLLNVYVYLGTHPIWPYISTTAHVLLRPVSFLTFPKVDLAPIVGIVVVYGIAELLLRPAVMKLFQTFAA